MIGNLGPGRGNVFPLPSRGPDTGGALKHGGGDGTSGGMEARIAKLEANVDHLVKQVDRLVDIPERLGVLEERVSHLPGKGFVVTSISVGTAALIAILTALSKLGILVAG